MSFLRKRLIFRCKRGDPTDILDVKIDKRDKRYQRDIGAGEIDEK